MVAHPRPSGPPTRSRAVRPPEAERSAHPRPGPRRPTLSLPAEPTATRSYFPGENHNRSSCRRDARLGTTRVTTDLPGSGVSRVSIGVVGVAAS